MISITQYNFIGGTRRSSCSSGWSTGGHHTWRIALSAHHCSRVSCTSLSSQRTPASVQCHLHAQLSTGSVLSARASSSRRALPRCRVMDALASRPSSSSPGSSCLPPLSWTEEVVADSSSQRRSHQHLGDKATTTVRAAHRWSGIWGDDTTSSTELVSGRARAASRADQRLPWIGCTFSRLMDSRSVRVDWLSCQTAGC